MARRPAKPPSKSTSKRAPRKSTAKKTTSKAPARKKPTKRTAKAAAPKKRASPRKPSGKAVTSALPPKPRNWKRWLLTELGVVGVGAAAGLLLAGGFLWSRAKHDVEDYLASPPRLVPGVVWSAPVEVRAGQPATVSDLAGDLLAAGYEKVSHLDAPQQFTVSGGEIAVWTASLDGPDLHVDGGKAQITIADGYIAATRPEHGVVLRPTALATLGDLETDRTLVDLDVLSPWVEPAVLSMEDSRFRTHHGVDPLGIARALLHNLTSSGGMHGGSTLTQQLAKNLFLSSERTLQRKVREAFFAAALESSLTKDEILELYLAEVYLGQVGGVPIHGVEQAARAWFGVSAERLTIDQAAVIAGVISSPNTYSPVRHPDRAIERRDVVLDRMVATGAVGLGEAVAAKGRTLEVSSSVPGKVRRAPWAVDATVDQLEETLGDGGLSGYHVYTSIQPVLQRAAERAVTEGMTELDTDYPKAAGAQIALVAVRVTDGAIVAMVGGRDYATSPFNRATHAWRQAGSTVKPLTLLAAFDADPSLTPLSRVLDEPITRRIDGKAWTPANYDGAYKGEISIREAIEASRNIPAVKLAEEVGPERLQSFYREAGLSRAHHLPSAALGAFEATPLQMASAYTVFPGGGTMSTPRLVTGVSDSSGATLLDFDPDTDDISSARASALATAVLQGVITDGTGARAARYGVRDAVGGKTGTTDDYRDAWFVGFTPELAVAVWVGRDRGGAVGLSGSRAALPTWSRFVVATATDSGEFPIPDGVVTEQVCAESHRPARAACDLTYGELFPKEHVPRAKCDIHGSPVVEVGRLFGGLFSRRGDPAIEGEGPGEDGAVAVP